MKSYSAAYSIFFLGGAAVLSAVAACATGADTPPLTGGFQNSSGGTSTSSGNSSGSMDATTSSSSGGSSSGGSSSGYGDDSTNPSSSSSSSSSGAGDDSPVVTPGPTCVGGQACVDAVPSGWNGFVQLLVTTGAAAPCAAPYNTVQPAIGGQTNPDGGPATCGACTCGVPDGGVSCTVPVENGNTGCFLIGPETDTQVPSNQCTQLGNGGSNGHVGSPAASGTATCVAQGGAVTTPPPAAVAMTATACAMAGDGGAGGDAGAATIGPTCLSGQACSNLPSTADAGTPSGVCIYQAGVQSCPPSGTTLFTNTFVVGAVEDSRGCGCTCGAPTCPGDGYVAGFTAAGCSGAPSYTFDAGAKCVNIGSNRPTYAYYHLSRSGSLGTCGAANVAPTGAVDIDGGSATTFCCIP